MNEEVEIKFLCIICEAKSPANNIAASFKSIKGFFRLRTDVGFLYYYCGKVNIKKRLTKKLAWDFIIRYSMSSIFRPDHAKSDEAFLDMFYERARLKTIRLINSHNIK